MYFKDYSTYDDIKNEHKIRDLTLSRFFGLFGILYTIVPALVVLKLCGVVDMSWLTIGILWGIYEIINYGSDLLRIFIRKRDHKEWVAKCKQEIMAECAKEKENAKGVLCK